MTLTFVLISMVTILLLPCCMRKSRSTSVHRRHLVWLSVILLLALFPLFLPANKAELERLCLFGGTATQTQVCLATQQAVIEERLAIYWGSLTVIFGGGFVIMYYLGTRWDQPRKTDRG